jgi:hypothetical protein
VDRGGDDGSQYHHDADPEEINPNLIPFESLCKLW